ncbi:RHS repeat-associated core domain-containing protein [Myroides sp. C6-3]|uniref:RHS repeat-associated core domain-containing protein n=1 Tax=Myroides sp. C6-3 TaxID=3400535 RepID=UPI003D2F6CB6
MYGKLRNLVGDRMFIPFRQLGQYEDIELDGLYYNRFRYYDSNSGLYISKDPIGLAGNNPTFYAYVWDSNGQVDVFGLDLRPENGYIGGKRHGLKLSNKDAQILANNTRNPLPHGRWGSKTDLAYAGKLADQLEPGGFMDFPVNQDTKSVVFHSGIDVDTATPFPATHYRLRNNGNGTFHGFPIDATAELIRPDSKAIFKNEYK